MRRTHSPLSWILVPCCLGVIPVAVAESPDSAARTPLTFEQRVACTERVEDAYWSHRFWPGENSLPKPPRHEVISREQVAAKVERSLLYEAAVEQVFGQPLDPQRIQAEVDRIFKRTQHPELLNHIVEALDHDPYLVAECFVRPRLAERLVKERYAWDKAIHSALRERAEAELLALLTARELDGSSATITESRYVRVEEGGVEEPDAGTDLFLSPDEWHEAVTRLARRFPGSDAAPPDEPFPLDPEQRILAEVGRGFSPLHEEANRFAAVAVVAVDERSLEIVSVAWPKAGFDGWLESIRNGLRPVASEIGVYALPKASSSDLCLDDTWSPVVWGAPEGRSGHSGVWTGTELIVWGGGWSGGYAGSGGRYDPVADSWVPASTTNAPSPRSNHTAVWTGTEMIVWGGYTGSPDYYNTGGRYNPATDTWVATSTSAAPSSRERHSAVWTGTEMIVWGGWGVSGPTSTGGRYNPSTDSWTATSTSGAPLSRHLHVAAWTGTEMIIWGGYVGYAANTGGRYNPTTNSWTSTPTSGAPSGRYYFDGVWTGTELMVWGGYDGTSYLQTGGRFNPATSSWTTTTTTDAPSARYVHGAVWTGTEMIVWGGNDGVDYLNTGGRYDPSTNTWSATTTTNPPSPRYCYGEVWTGTEMIVWGGYDGGEYPNSGGRYNPVTDSWVVTSTSGAPSARYSHTSVWTGTEMIVWGGYDGTDLDTGSRYDAAADSWTPTTTSDAPEARRAQTAVWTGTEMIVWGGIAGAAELDTGGRYAPASDTWTSTTTDGSPSPRYAQAAVWTGTEMVIWGGRVGSSYLGTGGRYAPSTDSWTATASSGAPSARGYHAAVWTGEEMIVWGGSSGSALGTGGRYAPATDSWTPTSTSGAAGARYNHSEVWTGNEMIVWGGYSGSLMLGTGGRYAPATDSWTPTSTSGAPVGRNVHTGVWTGTEMIVWGGSAGDTIVFDSGGRYDPSTDAWTPTATAATPSARGWQTAVWSGSGAEMIVWGGYDGSIAIGTGGRYCASGLLGVDFGDAPDPTYPTMLASDGARHLLYGTLFLGTSADSDDDGQPTLGADGDDGDGTDDEDGVVLPASLVAGFEASIDVTASAAGLLNAWVDLNADGDWLDPGEQVFTDVAVTAGVNNLLVQVPLDATPGTTIARFRLDSAGGLAPTGLAADGEVEDHAVVIDPSAELEVMIVDAPDPVPEGGQLRYFVTVANHGSLDATGVTLTDTLPPEVVFASTTPGPPTCTAAGGMVTCDLGTLSSGGATQVVVVTEVPLGTTGTLSNVATVGLDQTDPILANNTDAESTTVVDDATHIFSDGFDSGTTSAWSATLP